MKNLMDKIISKFKSINIHHTKDLVEVIAIILAGFWAIYVFSYENRYKPSKIPPSLNISSSLEETGRNGFFIALEAKVAIKNTSKKKAKILISWYSVAGYNVKLEDSNIEDKKYVESIEENLKREEEKKLAIDRILRYTKLENETVIEVGNRDLPLPKMWLEPDEEYSMQKIIYVPIDKNFDLIRYRVNIYAAKDDQGLSFEWLQPDPKGFLGVKIKTTFDSEKQKQQHEKFQRKKGVFYIHKVCELSLWNNEGR